MEEQITTNQISRERILRELGHIAFADVRSLLLVEGGALTVADTAGLSESQAAAAYLHLEETPSVPEEAPQVWYRVQVGAFREKANADNMLKKLRAAGFADAYIKEGVS